jgi:hypothetical protein
MYSKKSQMSKKNVFQKKIKKIYVDFSQILCKLGLVSGSSVIKGDAFSPPICLVSLLVAKKAIAPSGVQ